MLQKSINEDSAFAEIATRLTEKYPTFAAARVAQIVADVRAEMASAKIRAFVPVLAEKEAKKRLKAESDLVSS